MSPSGPALRHAALTPTRELSVNRIAARPQGNAHLEPGSAPPVVVNSESSRLRSSQVRKGVLHAAGGSPVPCQVAFVKSIVTAGIDTMLER
jgi:hypothetical protein